MSDVDPKRLRPGTVMRHKNGDATVTLLYRKQDNTGWWNTDGSGLWDKVIVDGLWTPRDVPVTEENPK